MKLLAIHSGNNENDKILQTCLWRIARPLRELKKHTDWNIVEKDKIMYNIDKFRSSEDFTEEELEKHTKELGTYDVIWGSYAMFSDPMAYSLCLYLGNKYGVKVVIDIDDDIFDIGLDNFGWWLKMDDERTRDMRQIIITAPYITTSTVSLAKKLRSKRDRLDETVFITPNYISKSDYPRQTRKERKKIVVGYFGGSSHFNDVHNTHVVEALAQVMHENKNVYAVSTGIPVENYLPKARYKYDEGGRGNKWTEEVFPRLKYHISLGPLTGSTFNQSKSDIKWQESTVMGAAFICSNREPYKHIKNAIKVDNTQQGWYEAIKLLLEDKEERQKLVDGSLNEINYLEDTWQVYEDTLNKIYRRKDASYTASTKTIIMST